jgi:leader peptidase (prepilin peptidase)/N-methyltransferase
MPTDALVPALVAALGCGLLALAMPTWLAGLPEPVAAPESESDPPTRLATAKPKEPYADIATLPWLRPVLVVASAVTGAVLGASLGWSGALLVWLPLVPIGALLFVVDWRTTLLPTRIVWPAYAVVTVGLAASALVDRDVDALVRAGWGWLLLGGWFWLCWWFVGAWGFGDVRLARLLGPALGYLGWSELVLGLMLMLLLGALGGVLLTLRDRSLRRRYPYGPFMLLGAVLAVPFARDLARSLGYPVA